MRTLASLRTIFLLSVLEFGFNWDLSPLGHDGAITSGFVCKHACSPAFWKVFSAEMATIQKCRFDNHVSRPSMLNFTTCVGCLLVALLSHCSDFVFVTPPAVGSLKVDGWASASSFRPQDLDLKAWVEFHCRRGTA